MIRTQQNFYFVAFDFFMDQVIKSVFAREVMRFAFSPLAYGDKSDSIVRNAPILFTNLEKMSLYIS